MKWTVKCFFLSIEINESIDNPFIEMDPEIQFFSNSNYTLGAKCDYYLENHFCSKVVYQNIANRLSFFRLNIKSIPKHFNELEIYINILKLEFTMTTLTETWLDESNKNLYNMPMHNCISRSENGDRVVVYLYVLRTM